MVSPLTPSPWRSRRLYELLEEQQDPSGWLSEREHASLLCWPGGNVFGILWRPSSLRLKRRLLRCKLIVKKVLSLDCLCRIGNDCCALDFDRLYFSSGLSEKALNIEVKEREQLSPISVLDIHLNEVLAGSHSVKNSLPSSTDISAPEGKRGWHQTKKLMFGCLKEMERGHLSSEMPKSMRGWSQFTSEIRKIGWEIEGTIFEDISEEIVREMIGINSSFTKFETC